jgi:23S rRNA (cytidine1920-2'-O)/16S rRNA (cytidine1409-2'-O)-methyltransferase
MDLLAYLLEQGLVPDERTAAGLILSGRVLVNERPETSARHKVGPAEVVRIKGQVVAPVSRGASKLEPVLQQIRFTVGGAVALDLGASTGGFTQILLKHDAARVYAVDVGYGILAPELRNDARVVVLERTNARLLTSEQIPDPIDRVVGDLSFIRWQAVLPAVTPLLAPAAELLLLVKPQFELAANSLQDATTGGVIRSGAVLRDCLAELYNVWMDNGLAPLHVVLSPVAGAKGNREFFVHLSLSAPALSRQEYETQAQAAVAEAAL